MNEIILPKRSFNPHLTNIILEYIPTQEKFQIIQHYKWNEITVSSLKRIFLEQNQEKFDYYIQNSQYN